MLFQRRERRISRIMIVEDEPLVAFDNENMLQEAGYLVVATVDGFAAAHAVLEAEALDLVLTDITLSGEGDGLDVARAAVAKGVAVLMVTGGCTDDARSLAVGCLAKPYSERVLLAALNAVDDHIQGKALKKLPKQLTLYAD